jgi:DNA-binding transcriptional MerR regulator
MRIGEVAASCGCSVETIRYYEKIGLLPPPARLANEYRSYDAIHRKKRYCASKTNARAAYCMTARLSMS